MSTNEHVRFSLLENALDYLVVAVTWLRGEPDQQALKQAVLNLYAGVSLLSRNDFGLRTRRCCSPIRTSSTRRRMKLAASMVRISRTSSSEFRISALTSMKR